MILAWDEDAWEDYLYWQTAEPPVVRKIHALLRECLRTPFEGTGKPERLRGNLTGAWSRRITHEHRLVYRVFADRIHVLQCRGHYDD